MQETGQIVAVMFTGNEARINMDEGCHSSCGTRFTTAIAFLYLHISATESLIVFLGCCKSDMIARIGSNSSGLPLPDRAFPPCHAAKNKDDDHTIFNDRTPNPAVPRY